jgi:two-component system, cell cycle sensor histidine kinase and response regulator CckA
LNVSPLDDGFRLVRVIAGSSKKENLKSFHSQRLETLGMLAGGVAHDFNNILAGILGHITYLKTILPGVGSHVESLNSIEEGAKKASLITQQILNFSKLDTTEKAARVNLADLVVKTHALLRGAISPEFVLERVIPEKPVWVLTVEAKMAQVIANLVINARDALKQNGTINVSVEIAEDEAVLCRAFGVTELGAKRYAALKVVDNGTGMPAEVLERAFEPYFSTKKDKGTGLGLSTVQAIVRTFGGAISIDSEINVGTAVTVFLPIVESVEEPQQDASSRRNPHQLEGGSERVLVVDDEYPVRNVLYLSLEHLGYQVDIASSGLEAIEKYSHPANVFDLVILDMLMPHLSGEEVFFRLKEIDPNVRVLVISGFCSEESVRNILDNGGRDFIQKPFTIGELSKKVRECLS